tara:strand:- start:998 stop:1219 length:222 start_codon:yes stop_codon:yes gene_type:complete
MVKIYMKLVHEEDGWTFSFGTDDKLEEWEAQEKEWKEQGLSVAGDTVEDIGDADDIAEAIELINNQIVRQRQM